MKVKIICFSIFIIVLSASLLTQAIDQKIGQLEKRLPTVTGTEKVRVLLSLAEVYRYKDLTRVVDYAHQALKLCRDMKILKGTSTSLIYLSAGYRDLGNYKKALEYAKQALEIDKKIGEKTDIAFSMGMLATIYGELNDLDRALQQNLEVLKIEKELGNEKKIAVTFINIGYILMKQTKYDEALEYYLNAEKKLERIGDKYAHATALISIGEVYKILKNYSKALEYYRQSLKLREQIGDKPGTSELLNRIGSVYKDSKDYNRALDYYTKALDISRQVGNQRLVARSLRNLGSVYHLRKDFRKALEYYRASLEIVEKTGDQWETPAPLISMGILYNELKNYDRALEYLHKSLEIAKKIKSPLLHEIYRRLFDVYASKGDYKQGLRYYRLFHQADKDLLDEKSRKQINELQARYETEKKEQEIEVLKKNNDIKAKENLLLKKNNEIQSLRLGRETFNRNALIIGFILVVIILALLFKKYLHLFAFWKKQRYIGQFRLMEKIGSGGMGTVYKAHSLLDKSEIAAVKILKEELFNNETSKKRFKREAMIIDKLEHPHIVKVFERGESKQRLFIAMEYLQGKTLENRINEKGQLSMGESLHIMVQISDTISFVHSKNIIHRDLKPANVMLIETNGHRDFVKLLDFGLAKMEFASKLTQSGNLLGTLQYLAPEQVLDAHSTCANDIFSMGVTFYHMLCGKNPFTGETALDVMNRIISKNPPGIMEYRPDLPGELNDLVMWMLNKKPQHRPPAVVIKDTLQHLINKHLASVSQGPHGMGDR